MGIEHLINDSQAPAPGLSQADAAGLALAHYGIEGHCRALAGERDRNFRLDGIDGSHHLLKVWNHTQDKAVVDFQMALLDHLQEHAPELPVPKVVPDKAGKAWCTATSARGQTHMVCLLSWLDGAFLRDIPMTTALRADLGKSLALLDRAISDFEHPGSRRDMLWDVSRAHRLRALLASVQNNGVASRTERMLDLFESDVLPALPALPRQVIHADFNLDNILVGAKTSKICGIIDFGDALRAPRICDLAIACAYQLDPGEDPSTRLSSLILAYHDQFPLLEDELRVLPGLIGARLVSSILITSHMATLHPENRDYLLIDTRAAAENLGQLLGQDFDALTDRWIRSCTEGRSGAG